MPGYKIKIESEGNIIKSSKSKKKTNENDRVKRISSYKLLKDNKMIKIAFVSEAENYSLPVALASCFAKYIRELLIHEFNKYFTGKYPNLKPTKGYYKDGVRFLTDLRELDFPVNKYKQILVRKR